MTHSHAVHVAVALSTMTLMIGECHRILYGQELDGTGTNIQVLARGPIHEAFAEPIVFDPTAGTVVPKAPPDLIEEMPPDQKPAGDNVAWIPGYWSWDQDRADFIWVSGFWRIIPPGREWIPGYWTEVSNGWQWVSGFWANAADDEIQYLPQPPEVSEAEPSTPAPSSDHFWVPGMWYWRVDRYVWRPGYWTLGQINWAWVPAHYIWTPGGYVFVGGFWDYAPPLRGVLFAPVYFNTPLFLRPGYYYTPSIALDLSVVTNYLFVGLGFRQYYFGDYYAANYLNSGIYPWFSFSSTRLGFDPIYAYYSRQLGRTDPHWTTRIRSEYEHRRDDASARPPRTIALGTSAGATAMQSTGQRTSLVKPLSALAASQTMPMRMENLPQHQRAEFARIARHTQDFTRQRVQLESDARTRLDLGRTPKTPLSAGRTEAGRDVIPRRALTPGETNSTVVKRPKSPIADMARTPALTGKTELDSRLRRVIPAPQLRDELKSVPQERPERSSFPNSVPRTTLKPALPGVSPGPQSRTLNLEKNLIPKQEPRIFTPGSIPRTESPSRIRPESPRPEIPADVPRLPPRRIGPTPLNPPHQPRVDLSPNAGPELPRSEVPRIAPGPPASRIVPTQPIKPPAQPRMEPFAPRHELPPPTGHVDDRPRPPDSDLLRRERELKK